MKNFAIIILLILVSLFLFLGAFHYRNKYNEVLNAPSISDTVVIKDTVKIKVPEPKEVKIIKKDTVYLPSPTLKDTVDIALPLEEKIYGDSTFRAVIQGYNPTLKEITIYPTNTTITEKSVVTVDKFKYKPNISLSVGYGYGLIHKQNDLFIGVTLSIPICYKK